MRIVILTGSQLRHDYFRMMLATNSNIDVVASYCEYNNVLAKNVESTGSNIQKSHLDIRKQSELDFFEDVVSHLKDESNPQYINKGRINSEEVVSEIANYNADLVISYGCSIIKSKLLQIYEGKFVNVHLGLSPYYKGSGTNYWPFVNNEPQYCGVTFMHIDEGVDTGKIIHQIAADYVHVDHPIVIGNRLIKKMTKVAQDLILNFYSLEELEQDYNYKGKVYKNRDFTDESLIKYYDNFQSRLNCFETSKVELPRLVQQRKIGSL